MPADCSLRDHFIMSSCIEKIRKKMSKKKERFLRTTFWAVCLGQTTPTLFYKKKYADGYCRDINAKNLAQYGEEPQYFVTKMYLTTRGK